MDLDKLSKDVEYCKASYTTQEKLVDRLVAVETDIKYIRKWLDAPHVCKWNGKVGELLEFKTDTSRVRDVLFRMMEEQERRLGCVEDYMIEVRKGGEILERIEHNQNVLKHEREGRKLSRRDGIILLMIGGAITLMFGIVLEMVRGII